MFEFEIDVDVDAVVVLVPPASVVPCCAFEAVDLISSARDFAFDITFCFPPVFNNDNSDD